MRVCDEMQQTGAAQAGKFHLPAVSPSRTRCTRARAVRSAPPAAAAGRPRRWRCPRALRRQALLLLLLPPPRRRTRPRGRWRSAAHAEGPAAMRPDGTEGCRGARPARAAPASQPGALAAAACGRSAAALPRGRQPSCERVPGALGGRCLRVLFRRRRDRGRESKAAKARQTWLKGRTKERGSNSGGRPYDQIRAFDSVDGPDCPRPESLIRGFRLPVEHLSSLLAVFLCTPTSARPLAGSPPSCCCWGVPRRLWRVRRSACRTAPTAPSRSTSQPTARASCGCRAGSACRRWRSSPARCSCLMRCGGAAAVRLAGIQQFRAPARCGQTAGSSGAAQHARVFPYHRW